MMNDPETSAILTSNKSLKPEFSNLEKLPITSSNFTIGRGLQNSVVIPFISISRIHCTLNYNTEIKEWFIVDNSSFGVQINGYKLGKGLVKKINHGDIISLEPSGEFTYKFTCYDSRNEEYETPKKRIKQEPQSPKRDNFMENVQIKFEESQNHEIKHIEDKIKNAKDMQKTSVYLKQQLQQEMEKKIKQLEERYASQIESLIGEKKEVEMQKTLLLEERNKQLTAIKEDVQGKINQLLNQIKNYKESESELLKENNLLKEKLIKERNEFLLELNKENSSKQDMLEKLEQKIKEQEEIRLKEKKEMREALRKEAEQLKLAKEKELEELIALKRKQEQELKEELDRMKSSLEKRLELTENQKLQLQQQLNEQLEMVKQHSDMETAEIEVLRKERDTILKSLEEAQTMAKKTHEELQQRVVERETELAALAADRIQKQAEQSGEVIQSLQAQLEKVKNQLLTVESEKDTLLKNLNTAEPTGEGTSKETMLTHVGALMESELQCSICAELFVEATTLSCSHTYCKYCITKWNKKKKDCPICRAPITSECRSLVLDSFIDKMVENLTEEMKTKRQDLLKQRAEEVIPSTSRTSATTPRRARGRGRRRSLRSTTSTAMVSTIGPIPTVDLTMNPTPIFTTPLVRPMLPFTMLQMAMRHQMPLRENRVTELEDEDEVSLMVFRARTTAGTEGASAVAPQGTGPPAAPSDDSLT